MPIGERLAEFGRAIGQAAYQPAAAEAEAKQMRQKMALSDEEAKQKREHPYMLLQTAMAEAFSNPTPENQETVNKLGRMVQEYNEYVYFMRSRLSNEPGAEIAEPVRKSIDFSLGLNRAGIELPNLTMYEKLPMVGADKEKFIESWEAENKEKWISWAKESKDSPYREYPRVVLQNAWSKGFERLKENFESSGDATLDEEQKEVPVDVPGYRPAPKSGVQALTESKERKLKGGSRKVQGVQPLMDDPVNVAITKEASRFKGRGGLTVDFMLKTYSDRVRKAMAVFGFETPEEAIKAMQEDGKFPK